MPTSTRVDDAISLQADAAACQFCQDACDVPRVLKFKLARSAIKIIKVYRGTDIDTAVLPAFKIGQAEGLQLKSYPQ